MPVLTSYLESAINMSQEMEAILKCFNYNWNIVRAMVREFPFSFYDYIYLCHNGNKIDYDYIIYRMSRLRKCNFFKFAIVLCEIMTKHRCSDISVIADVLHLICRMCYGGNFTGVVYYLDWLKHRYCNSYQQYATKFEVLLRFPYKELPKFWSPNVDVVRHAGVAGNSGLLDVLLQFGAMPIKPIDGPYEWLQVELVMKHLVPRSYNIRTKIEEFFLRNLHVQFNKDARQRLYLMMRIMEIFCSIQRKPEDVDSYINFVRMLFSAIPDPFVTSDEMRRSLGKLFLNIYPYEDVVQLVKTFESHFPESCQASAPRSLQHLCRFQVRENLRASGKLTYGVSLLPIPNKMKDFVLLKDVCGKRNPIKTYKILSTLMKTSRIMHYVSLQMYETCQIDFKSSEEMDFTSLEYSRYDFHECPFQEFVKWIPILKNV